MAQYRRYKHMKGVLDFIPHHHLPQRIFTDCLRDAAKENWKFPKDFEEGHRYTLEVICL